MHAPAAIPFIPRERVGELVVLVALCYAGDLAEGERVIAPLRTLAEPIVEMVGPMPYPGMFALTADIALPGRRLAARSLYLEGLNDEIVKTIVTHSRAASAPFAMAQLRILGGAMARVPAEETAFGHRDKPFMLLAVTEWEDPAEDEFQRAWAEQFFAALRPYASGVYVNFLQNEGEARVREAYRQATFERLAEVKAQYDPDNLFRSNQNIPPAQTRTSRDERAA
jgi:FAD/FMN-containing dehydrogenase